ncbi:MAG: hypothetical protein ACR2FV_14915 [Ornithinimicrobium sp.]|uniref:hypothetical protein n=1 Tax=Ornithinimicrobium sp. TaxID=1977084 RepID=UPI003D9B7CDB
MRTRKDEIARRVASREGEIEHLLKPPEATKVELVSESEGTTAPGPDAPLPGEDRMEAIRRSVSEEPTAPADSASSTAYGVGNGEGEQRG